MGILGFVEARPRLTLGVHYVQMLDARSGRRQCVVSRMHRAFVADGHFEMSHRIPSCKMYGNPNCSFASWFIPMSVRMLKHRHGTLGQARVPQGGFINLTK